MESDALLRRFFDVFLFEDVPASSRRADEVYLAEVDGCDVYFVWNPGQLPPPLTPEKLRHPHSSIARNHRVCETLFLARSIEKFGTGTLMMIRESLAHALPEPDFVQRSGELVTTVWRDWLTEKVLKELRINEWQRSAIVHLKTHGRISNPDYRRLHDVSKPTASRDLEELRKRGVLARVGSTGKGTYYVLSSNGLTLGSMDSGKPKGSQWDQTTHAGTAVQQTESLPPVPVPAENGDIKGTSAGRPKSAKNAPNAPSAPQPSSARKRARKGQRDEGRGTR